MYAMPITLVGDTTEIVVEKKCENRQLPTGAVVALFVPLFVPSQQ